MNDRPLIKAIVNPFFNIENFERSDIISDGIIKEVMLFHKSLPEYQPTPTVSLSSLATKLSVTKLYVKDESKRFDLNAFKVLGASYAMAKLLANYLNMANQPLRFSKIVSQQKQYKNLVFITTTDGNHGRAVAWAAQKFGCQAIVYMPKGSSLERLEAIKSYGAEAHISELGYDDCVEFTNKLANENNWILIQDTAWAGYQKIPINIMQGYFTLITEFQEQCPNEWPTHVFVQAGVGSLTASMAIYLCFHSDKAMPVLVVVEPTGAPCFYESIKIGDGKPHRTDGELDTMMAGLACGEPSDFAWNVLKRLSSAFLVCEDEVSINGMKKLAYPEAGDVAIVSGESGAVSLGLVVEIMSNPTMINVRDQLNLDEKSRVLLFSTEGNTDADIYDSVVS